MIKISVLIPVYNTSKYLRKCLNSIINQSLKEIEIICVNDGSTDNSLSILQEYKKCDKRIIIINKKNGGLTSARNEALKIAQGKYCLNIDSDDWIEEEYLKIMYEKAEQNNSDIVISDIIFEYENKRNWILKDLELGADKSIDGKTYLDIFFKRNFYGFTWNKLIKRELYLKSNTIYNEKIFLFEDVEVIAKLGFNAKTISKVNRAFYHYRQAINGSKKINEKHVDDIRECFSNLINYFLSKDEKELVKIIEKVEYNILFFYLINKDYQKFKNFKTLKSYFLRESRKFRWSFNRYGIRKYQIFIVTFFKIFPNEITLKFLSNIYTFCKSKKGKNK